LFSLFSGSAYFAQPVATMMSTHRNSNEVRFLFRVLAGILAGLMLLVGVPILIRVAIEGPWHFWLAAMNVALIGIGFFGTALTGRWFRFRRRDGTNT
jgi:hypothetical protein